jgi:hypothetical protein
MPRGPKGEKRFSTTWRPAPIRRRPSKFSAPPKMVAETHTSTVAKYQGEP